MNLLEQNIFVLFNNILANRQDVILLACQQRAKFEGWLKFELASAISNENNFSQVILEDGYTNGGRSDISFLFQGNKYYIEMKTANTNWRAEGLENRSRPVTANMKRIVDDICVLRDKSASAHALLVFVLFPIPDRLWRNTREQLNYHLRHIEESSGLLKDVLINNASYIKVTDDFGICPFVIQII
ncbi:MAG: hypothetical protein ABSE95_15005 [Thermodesulfobacteriota bacterium]|jgi:hypothetical protein